MLEEKESLLHEIQTQEREFKLQNQTAMEELALVGTVDCATVYGAVAPDSVAG